LHARLTLELPIRVITNALSGIPVKIFNALDYKMFAGPHVSP